MSHLRRGAAAASVLLGLAAALVPAPTAQAAACDGQIRYASSTNTIYVQSGSVTPADIIAICPSAPLVQTDPVNKIWQLNADLVVQNGSTLTLASPVVGTLRLRSPATSLKTEVSQITAMYGTIAINGITITSWDPATSGPDTNTNLPAGAPADARARPFIRAVSYLEGVTPRESTMTINNSDIGHLGYYAAESYGVAFKARGCDLTHLAECEALNVYGSETNSRFHHNYMGTYTYNAKNMVFDHNEYDHNVMYGLDPHDDSDYLTITNNESHDNGDHGIICSQRCDHLLIAGNTVWHNGVPPFAFPDDPDLSDNQIHGIMIHRGITDTIIENNVVTDHPNGAGIAVFDSSGNTIRNNTVDGAKYGLRVSVGSANTVFTGNTVTDSGQYGVFTYQGSDVPAYTTPSGRPTNNSFSGNTFNGANNNMIKVGDADGTLFTGNTFVGTASARLQNSVGTLFTGNTLPSALNFGSYSSATTTFSGITTPVKASSDSTSTTMFTSNDGTVYDYRQTTLTPAGGSLMITTSNGGTVTPRPVRVLPASGTAYASISGWGGSSFTIKAQSPSALSFSVSGLTPGATYQVQPGAGTPLTVQASAAGTVTFGFTPPGPAEVAYLISKL